MPVEIFLHQDYEYQHEREAFDNLVEQLEDEYSSSQETIAIIGNYKCGGFAIDATLIKRDAIVIIEFKNYGGEISFKYNGNWFAGKTQMPNNPFEQVKGYRNAFCDFIKSNLKIDLQNPNWRNFTKAVILFQNSISLKDLPTNFFSENPWFRITDFDNCIKSFNQITYKDINLTSAQIQDIPKLLGVEKRKQRQQINSENLPTILYQNLYDSLLELNETLSIANLFKTNFEKYKIRHEQFLNFFYENRPTIIEQNVLKELSFRTKLNELAKYVDEQMEEKIVSVINANSNANNILQQVAKKKIANVDLKSDTTVQEIISAFRKTQKELKESKGEASINELAFKVNQTFLYDRGLWSLKAFEPIKKQLDKRPAVLPYLHALFEILRTWFAEDMIWHWKVRPSYTEKVLKPVPYEKIVPARRTEHRHATAFSYEWFQNLSSIFDESVVKNDTAENARTRCISEIHLPLKLSTLFKNIANEIKKHFSEDEYMTLLDFLKLRWIESDKINLNDIYLIELRTNTIFNLENDSEFLKKGYDDSSVRPNEYCYEPTFISVLENIGDWGYGKIGQESILSNSYFSIDNSLKDDITAVIKVWKSSKPSYFEWHYHYTNCLVVENYKGNGRDISIELKTEPKIILQYLNNFKDEWERNGMFSDSNIGDRNFMLLLKQFKNEKRIDNVGEILKGELPKSKKVFKEMTSKNSSALSELNNLIGLKSVKKEIESLLNFVKIRKVKHERGLEVTPSSLHMVFTGNPGTGKTIVARLIGRIYYDLGLLNKGHCVEVSRTDLVGEYIGHTAPLTTKKFKEAIGGVLFIDEAYSLAQDSEKDFGKEVIDTLNKLMEDFREQIVVIVAGYPSEMEKFLKLNRGLASRFPTKIYFEDYSIDENIQILEKFCTDNKHQLSVGAREKIYLLQENNKFKNNARSARNLFELILKNQSLRLNRIIGYTDEELVTFEPEDVPDNFNNS